jgi:hypothetical protein
MKQILFAVAFLVSICSNGQDYSGSLTYRPQQDLSYSLPLSTTTPGILSYSLFDRNVKIVSKYDTTILYKGEDNCIHLFAAKQVYEGTFGGLSSCCVLHDAAGCPDAWSNEKKICTICLKHIQIKETRTAIKLQDEYELAVERLNKLINKN